MPRKRWIKLWTQESLYGSISKELEPAERWAWIGLLCLAGDSIIPGIVCAAPDIPWTDEQISAIIKIPLKTWLSAKEKMIKHNKITINEGIIHIVNWEKYQSEYERTKKYRKSTAKSTKKLNVEKSVENVSSITEQNRSDQRNNITTTTRDREFKELVNFYESNIGLISPFVAEKFKEAYDYYPADYIRHAIEEAALRDRGRRSWAYVEAILKRLENDYGNPKQRREHGEIK